MADRIYLMRLLLFPFLAALAWGCPAGQPLGPSAPAPPVADYVETQAKNLTGAAAPYVEAYARAHNIQLAALLPHSAQPGVNVFVINSADAVSGDWTYFSSATTRLYELRQTGTCFLALTSPSAPSAAGRWTLSLYNADYKLISRVNFRTTARRGEPVDAITTRMTTASSAVEVTITYSHAGGGDPSGQEFTVTVPYHDRFRTPVVTGPRKVD